MFSEYFLQCLWAVTSLLAAITPDKRFLGVVDLYIRTVLGNRESFCGLWSLSDLPGKSMKKKRTHSLAIAPCYHCNTDHFDWLERDDLARSLPPAYHWMRVENRSTDKRCTDCCGGVGVAGGLMTDSFLHLIFDEGIVPCTFNRDIHYKEEVNTDRARQTKMFFVLSCFSDFFLQCTYSISCTAGEGFLILDCLYLQIGWWPFVCRWPTLRWHLIPRQKKMCGRALWHRPSAWGDY